MQELIDKLLEKRAKKTAKMQRLLEAPTKEARDLTPDEDKQFREIEDEIKAIDKRVGELRESIKRNEASAAAAAKVFSEPRAVVTSEPSVYRRDVTEVQYFRDLYRARCLGDKDAFARLDRNNRQVADEKSKREQRAITTVNGAGGKELAAAAA